MLTHGTASEAEAGHRAVFGVCDASRRVLLEIVCVVAAGVGPSTLDFIPLHNHHLPLT